MSARLATDCLSTLAGNVAVPRYRPSDLKAGIVHIGVGNFHRAHQAVYLDDLFNLGLDQDWAVVGSGVRAADDAMRQELAAQDWLTTVVAQEADWTAVRVTGVMVDFLKPGDAEAMLARLADPAIRIVSLTVTEGGYYIDPASHSFDAGHPDMVADARNLSAPNTAFGLILAGLKRRRDAGIPPFTVMSCDNIVGNGYVAESAVAGLAELVDPALARWVRQEVAFPNGMVDRITPATTDAERAFLTRNYGIEDRWPVFCERFKQWVLEDDFTAGRPALEKVGVQFVRDVKPFELMKIRILNGGHAAVAYPAALMDVQFVHEAMEEPLLRGFLAKLQLTEILPTVPPVPDTDLQDYRELIERRFANPKIRDTIQRLCFDGSNRQPKFILSSVADRLKGGQRVTGLALVSAFWCRYCYGETDSGAPIPPNDPDWARLHAHAKRAKSDPKAWLEMADLFGETARNADYRAAFSTALETIWAEGTRGTLAQYLNGTL